MKIDLKRNIKRICRRNEGIQKNNLPIISSSVYARDFFSEEYYDWLYHGYFAKHRCKFTCVRSTARLRPAMSYKYWFIANTWRRCINCASLWKFQPMLRSWNGQTAGQIKFIWKLLSYFVSRTAFEVALHSLTLAIPCCLINPFPLTLITFVRNRISRSL